MVVIHVYDPGNPSRMERYESIAAFQDATGDWPIGCRFTFKGRIRNLFRGGAEVSPAMKQSRFWGWVSVVALALHIWLSQQGK